MAYSLFDDAREWMARRFKKPNDNQEPGVSEPVVPGPITGDAVAAMPQLARARN